MNKRNLASATVAEIGLGCMNLSHAYGVAPEPAAAKTLLLGALDLGIDHFDTAALYGFGRNEELVGEVLQPFRQRLSLASKCGMTGIDGKRGIDGRPDTLKRTCQESLRRLRTDVIDLYYLHRWDKKVPIEESVGALADLVRAGHIRSIGVVGDLCSDAAEGARCAPHCRCSERIFAVDSQPGNQSARGVPGVGRRAGGVLACRAGLPGRRSHASKGLCGEGHPALDAEIPAAALWP